MKSKFPGKLDEIILNYKIWVSDPEGNGVLGDGKWKILKLIEEKGSLKAACDEMGYTYRLTWGNLRKIENFFGFPLLEKHRGGSEKGRTVLTPEGKKLVNAFDKLHETVDKTMAKGFREFLKELEK
jgi:molybdate transport system regulatory protein